MAEELIKDFVRVVEYLDHHFSFTDDQVGHCKLCSQGSGFVFGVSQVCSALVRVWPGMVGMHEHVAAFTDGPTTGAQPEADQQSLECSSIVNGVWDAASYGAGWR